MATFEEVTIGDVYAQLSDAARPRACGGEFAAPWSRVFVDSATLKHPGPIADSVSVVRFLLTGKVNGGDPEAYGGALYEIGLVPTSTSCKTPRRRRNAWHATATASKSSRGRPSRSVGVFWTWGLASEPFATS